MEEEGTLDGACMVGVREGLGRRYVEGKDVGGDARGCEHAGDMGGEVRECGCGGVLGREGDMEWEGMEGDGMRGNVGVGRNMAGVGLLSSYIALLKGTINEL